MAITVDVGKIKLVWRGTYSGSNSYEIDDLVQYDDGLTTSGYICVSPTTGNVPSTSGTVNTTYWNLITKGASSISAGTIDGQVQYKSSSGFGATTRLFFDSTNIRLGIGTTNPSYTLDVLGNTRSTNLIVSGISTLGITTVTDTLQVDEVLEKVNIVAGAANATSNIDVKTAAVWLFTSNSSGTWTHNIRGDASTSLNSMMAIGQKLTVVVISTQNSTSNYTANITIDGAAQTEYFLGGSAPSSGGGSGYDLYNWDIIKTADATFTVLANAKSNTI